MYMVLPAVHIYLWMFINYFSLCILPCTNLTECVNSILLLASGSTDSFVHIWTMGQKPDFIRQKLVGHTDMVFGVDFHPSEPLLATASADFSVRLWSLKHKNKEKNNKGKISNKE